MKPGLPSTIIAPSILSADFSDMRKAVMTIEESGADWIHVDVMDGQFVPNLTFGAKMVADLRPLSNLVFDVHLMIENPENLVEDFARAGADYLVFHVEAVVHAHRLIQNIRSLGVKPGISLVPSSPVSSLTEILPFVDQVLVMSVNPGFGGQKLITECLQKVSDLAEIRAARSLDFIINVDGGINSETASQVQKAGADALVSGSAFFNAPNPGAYVSALKGYKSV